MSKKYPSAYGGGVFFWSFFLRCAWHKKLPDATQKITYQSYVLRINQISLNEKWNTPLI